MPWVLQPLSPAGMMMLLISGIFTCLFFPSRCVNAIFRVTDHQNNHPSECKWERIHGGEKERTDVVLTRRLKHFMTEEVRATGRLSFKHLAAKILGTGTMMVFFKTCKNLKERLKIFMLTSASWTVDVIETWCFVCVLEHLTTLSENIDIFCSPQVIPPLDSN